MASPIGLPPRPAVTADPLHPKQSRLGFPRRYSLADGSAAGASHGISGRHAGAFPQASRLRERPHRAGAPAATSPARSRGTRTRTSSSPDFATQFLQALDNVIAVVRAAGGGDGAHREAPRVRHRSRCLPRATAPSAKVGARAWASYYPAMSLVKVAGLLEPGALVEIEGIAVLPAREGAVPAALRARGRASAAEPSAGRKRPAQPAGGRVSVWVRLLRVTRLDARGASRRKLDDASTLARFDLLATSRARTVRRSPALSRAHARDRGEPHRPRRSRRARRRRRAAPSPRIAASRACGSPEGPGARP